jgi:hypothetical protein
MNRSGILLLTPAIFCACCIAIAGCSTSSEDTSDEGLIPRPTKQEGAAASELKEVASKDTGTILGTVTYDGDPPARPDINMGVHKDVPFCVQGDHKEQTWIVDPANKGVANVVVWVNPPKGTYFPKPETKTWEEAVTVDQPHCVFVPHVVVLYPEYFNGKERVPTGQVLKVLNSATVGHNIKIAGSSLLNPTRDGGMMGFNSVKLFDRIKVDTQEMSMNCNVHTWMTGYALTFDHPYAARTNDKGQFTIKNVPAGAELTFMAWHEGTQPKRLVPPVEGGNKFTLNAGETKTLNFSIKAK